MKEKYGTYEQSSNLIKWTEHCIRTNESCWLRPREWTTRSDAYKIVYMKWFNRTNAMHPQFLEDNWATDNRELAEIIFNELDNQDIRVYLKMRWNFE